ncbi:MAG: TetR/AcrR family transcriptional regulator [Actinomycetota bacterium]|nr:TetR/AcrR family transcriptional regulator [Actinomycetota bacterium]
MSDPEWSAVARGPGPVAARLAPERIGLPDRRLRPRQREILDQLDTIFVDEGFAGLTIQQLAARLRCSRRTLYELAPSKDELVLFVIDRRLRRTGHLAAEVLRTVDDPAERLTAYVLTGTSRLRRASIRFREDVARFPAAQRVMAAHHRYASAIMAEIIDEGIARGRFHPLRAAVVAEIVDAAFERLQDPTILRDLGISFEDATEELTVLLARGLAADE